MADQEVLEVTLQVASSLETIGVDYVVGGSLASSMHGIPRSTQDVDILVFMRHEDVEPLVTMFEDEFYVEQAAVQEAVNRSSSFNLVHFETAFKVDLFVAGNDPWLAEERRRRVNIGDPEAGDSFHVSSAEDNLLHKLKWYQRGGEVSDQQWGDVLGVMKVQGDELDFPYLKRWAAQLGVETLLKQALQEAGLGEGNS